MFIDKIKALTNNVNRFKNGSPFIYVFENIKTLAEINKTMNLNVKPKGSKIIGKVIGDEKIVVISQKMIVVLLSKRCFKAKFIKKKESKNKKKEEIVGYFISL